MTLYEALDHLVDAIYEDVDLDCAAHKGVRKPLAEALRALRRVDRGARPATPPAAHLMRGVIHRAEVAPGDWRLLLSCGHTIAIRANERHNYVPRVGKMVKCWACRGIERGGAPP